MFGEFEKVALDYIKMFPDDHILEKTLRPPVCPGIYHQRLLQCVPKSLTPDVNIARIHAHK